MRITGKSDRNELTPKICVPSNVIVAGAVAWRLQLYQLSPNSPLGRWSLTPSSIHLPPLHKLSLCLYPSFLPPPCITEEAFFSFLFQRNHVSCALYLIPLSLGLVPSIRKQWEEETCVESSTEGALNKCQETSVEAPALLYLVWFGAGHFSVSFCMKQKGWTRGSPRHLPG